VLLGTIPVLRPKPPGPFPIAGPGAADEEPSLLLLASRHTSRALMGFIAAGSVGICMAIVQTWWWDEECT
jgi:hypothetical protein